jgi:hypothetical protein
MRTRIRTRGLATMMLGATALAATMAAGGCSWNESICGGGQYPVSAVGSTGRDCAPEGEEPPAGYVRYPEGKVPKHVGDEWDVYWDTHIIDETGAIVPA